MIDIKGLIKRRYAQDSDLKKSFDIPNSISKRILRKSCRKFKKLKISKEILTSLNLRQDFLNILLDIELGISKEY